jgi:hypothetical protein
MKIKTSYTEKTEEGEMVLITNYCFVEDCDVPRAFEEIFEHMVLTMGFQDLSVKLEPENELSGQYDDALGEFFSRKNEIITPLRHRL